MPELDQRTTLLLSPGQRRGGGLYDSNADMHCLVMLMRPAGTEGWSEEPLEQFDYTCDHLADVIERFVERIGLQRYAMYLQDFGGPAGFRLACRHPERVTELIVQNANASSSPFTPTTAATSSATTYAAAAKLGSGAVEVALAGTLAVAAEFGEWGLVQRLARELEARRLARGGES